MCQVQPSSSSQEEPGSGELPLIAINVLHKETMVKEPLHRADALKTLADVCCEEVFNDVQKRCFELINDSNSIVRKAALIGILKLSRNLPVVFADHHDN